MRKRLKKASIRKEDSSQQLRIHNSLAAYLYILPALIVLVIFLLYPLVSVLRMGFYENYNYMLDRGTGFGLRSFQYVINDPTFHLAVKNTLIIVGIGVPITIGLSVAVAVGINSLLRGKGVFQVIYFLPYVTSTFAIGVVFRWLFHSDYGLVNFLLEKLGVEGQRWLANMDLVMIPVTVLTIWSGLAFKVVLFLELLGRFELPTSSLPILPKIFFLVVSCFVLASGIVAAQRFQTILCWGLMSLALRLCIDFFSTCMGFVWAS